MGWEDYKNNRKSQSAKLRALVEKASNKQDYSDERFWRPTSGKDGTSATLIRFLPAPPGEDLAYVATQRHFFRGPTGITVNELCPKTLNNKAYCPICEGAWKLYKSAEKAIKEIAKQRLPKLSYTGNIYVLEDVLKPENNGKVFLYKWGKQVMDVIATAMKVKDGAEETFSEYEDVAEPIDDVFDFYDGAYVKLVTYQLGEWPRYENSKVLKKGAFLKADINSAEDDEKLKAVWETEYKLSEFVDPKLIKSADELQKIYVEAAGDESVISVSTTGDEGEALSPEESFDEEIAEAVTKPKRTQVNKAAKEEPADTEDSELALYEDMLGDSK